MTSSEVTRNNFRDEEESSISSGNGSHNRSESTSDDVRQRAYDLLNRMGGPDTEEEVKEWPQSPAEAKKSMHYSSYQQGDNPDRPHSDFSLNGGSSSSFSLAESFVNCVSGACRMASSEVISQQASILRNGYNNLRTVVIPEAEDRWFASRSKTYEPISGTFQTVNVSQGFRGRYSDHPSASDRR